MVILPPEKETACLWFSNHLAGRRKTSGHWPIMQLPQEMWGSNLEAGKGDEELHPRSGEGRLLDWRDFL